MDLENELRQAMAEHVTEMSAPADARVRGQAPPSPYGAPPDGVRDRRGRPGRRGRDDPGVSVVPPADRRCGRPGGQEARSAGHRLAAGGAGRRRSGARSGSPSTEPRVHTRAAKPKHPSGLHGPDLGMRQVAARLPSPGHQLEQDLPDRSTPARRRPRPAAGAVRADGSRCASCATAALKVPADLGLAPPMAKQSPVHGHPALRGWWPGDSQPGHVDRAHGSRRLGRGQPDAERAAWRMSRTA